MIAKVPPSVQPNIGSFGVGDKKQRLVRGESKTVASAHHSITRGMLRVKSD